MKFESPGPTRGAAARGGVEIFPPPPRNNMFTDRAVIHDCHFVVPFAYPLLLRFIGWVIIKDPSKC